MATQLRVIQEEKAKGKSATGMQEAPDKLAYLMSFNQNVSQAVARTMQNPSDFVFITITKINVILF